MDVSVIVEGERESLNRLFGVLETLKSHPPVEEIDESSERFWREKLPEWLISSFAPPVSAAESRSWLRMWRMSSMDKRRKMEDEAGWEIRDWLYWFSPGNEFWRISHVCWTEDAALDIVLQAADDPVPMLALEWLIEGSGAKIVR